MPNGGLVYSGRSDSMMKHGGRWIDGDSVRDATVAVRGVTQASVLFSRSSGVAFCVLHSSVVISNSVSLVAEARFNTAKQPGMASQGMPSPFPSFTEPNCH